MNLPDANQLLLLHPLPCKMSAQVAQEHLSYIEQVWNEKSSEIKFQSLYLGEDSQLNPQSECLACATPSIWVSDGTTQRNSVSVYYYPGNVGRCLQKWAKSYTAHFLFRMLQSLLKWPCNWKVSTLLWCLSQMMQSEEKKLIKNIQLFWTYHKFLDSLFPTETWNGLLFEKLFTNLMFRGLRD